MKKWILTALFWQSATLLQASVSWSSQPIAIIDNAGVTSVLKRVNAYPATVVAVNNSNNAVALFFTYTNPVNSDCAVIYTSFLPTGSSAWTGRRQIYPPSITPTSASLLNGTPPNGRPPALSIAINSSGQAVAVFGMFSKSPDNKGYVFASTLSTYGGTFSSAQQLDSFSGLSASNPLYPCPQVAIDDSGNAYAIWNRYNSGTSRTEVVTCRYNGTSWGAVTTLETGPALGAPNGLFIANAQLAVNSTGKGIAVWDMYPAGSAAGMPTRVSSATLSGGVWTLSDNPGGDTLGTSPNFPAVTIDSAGNGVAVWGENTGGATSFLVKSSHYNGASWGLPSTLSSTGLFCPMPRIALDGNNNAIAIWNQCTATGSNSRTFDIQSNISLDEGSTWAGVKTVSSSPIVLLPNFPTLVNQSSTPPNPYLTPAVQLAIQQTVASSGNIAAVWQQYDTIPLATAPWFDVVASSLRPISLGGAAASWETPTILSTHPIGDGETGSVYPTFPSVGFDNALAVWSFIPKTKFPNIFSNFDSSAIGIPVEDVSSPTNGSGHQLFQRFPGQGDLINRLQWTGTSQAAFYNIYAGSSTNLIGSALETTFDHHQIQPGVSVTYWITAVDSFGVESPALTFTVQSTYVVPQE